MSLIVWKTLNGFSRLLFLTAIFFYPAAGQYRFDQWTADNGLPQNSVYDIKQTRDGYLWLATLDGLVRFDGARFTIFNTSNTSGIINNRFISLLEDANGDLWAGTEQSGVVRMHNGRFSSYGKEQGLNLGFFHLLTGDEVGNPLWILQVTDPIDLTHFDGEKFIPYQPAPFSQTNFEAKINKYLACALKPGKLDELLCFFRGSWVSFNVPNYFVTGLDISGQRVVADKNGSLWITEYQAGLRELKPDGSSKTYNESNGLPGKSFFIIPGEEKISLLSQDSLGAIWLTDVAEMKSELVTRHPPESFTSLTYGYQDSEGSIWIGTLRGGLFRLRKQVISSYSTVEGHWDNNIYPVYQDRRGTIWVGSGKLFKYQNGTFELVKGSEGWGGVNSLGETPDGRLLVSVYQPGTTDSSSVMVLEENQFKPFYIPSPLKFLIFAIYSDEEQALWLGNADGLVRLKDGEKTFYDEKDGLAGNDVKVIIGDGSGGIWIGSYGGLTHYKDGKLQKWTEAEGLPARTVRALYLDSEGVLWIGSYDKGLVRFKDGKFTHYTTQNGLYNDGLSRFSKMNREISGSVLIVAFTASGKMN